MIAHRRSRRGTREESAEGASTETGPIGPVALSAFLVLLVLSPLMRGGNRQVALIVLEAIALIVLVALVFRLDRLMAPGGWQRMLLVFVVASPLWLAVVYLVPLPASLWSSLDGRSGYLEMMAGVGIQRPLALPLSLAPDATKVSLLAAIPLVAAFAAGFAADVKQLRIILRVLVGSALVQIVIGLLQAGGGTGSGLNFGADGGRPIGTFANPNHLANYVAMALAAYVWLAWLKVTKRRGSHARQHAHSGGRTLTIAIAGAVLLLAGVLMTRSRGAVLSGVPAAAGAAIVTLWLGSSLRSLRTILFLVAGAVAVGVALVGYEAVATRLDVSRMAADASYRTIQAATTLEGAWHFWPWGSGWGTYYEVYPRFQPASLVGTADYAHHDYAQMLFEGGVFAVLLMLAFGWLAVTRLVELIRIARREGRFGREEMACALCGLGLLGFLLHSFVEFNMHIPANAIVASLLAGVYLRPLPQREAEDTADD